MTDTDAEKMPAADGPLAQAGSTDPLETGRQKEESQAASVGESLLDRIRERAFQISLGPDSGTQEEDWFRAKHEILAEQGAETGARRAELEAARDAESRALLSAEIQAFGHP